MPRTSRGSFCFFLFFCCKMVTTSIALCWYSHIQPSSKLVGERRRHARDSFCLLRHTQLVYNNRNSCRCSSRDGIENKCMPGSQSAQSHHHRLLLRLAINTQVGESRSSRSPHAHIHFYARLHTFYRNARSPHRLACTLRGRLRVLVAPVTLRSLPIAWPLGLTYPTLSLTLTIPSSLCEWQNRARVSAVEAYADTRPQPSNSQSPLRNATPRNAAQSSRRNVRQVSKRRVRRVLPSRMSVIVIQHRRFFSKP